MLVSPITDDLCASHRFTSLKTTHESVGLCRPLPQEVEKKDGFVRRQIRPLAMNCNEMQWNGKTKALKHGHGQDADADADAKLEENPIKKPPAKPQGRHLDLCVICVMHVGLLDLFKHLQTRDNKSNSRAMVLRGKQVLFPAGCVFLSV